MNKHICMGRLTKEPDIRYAQNDKQTCVAIFSLAVDRRYKKEGQPTADFLNMIAYGKLAEFVEKYLHKGTKVVVESEFRNNNYVNSDGAMVYSYQFVANAIEFAESKSAAERNENGTFTGGNSFEEVSPDILSELPFG